MARHRDPWNQSLSDPRLRPFSENHPCELPYHRIFLRLTAADRERLFEASETWEAPAGAVLYHPGDSGEDFLIVTQGRLESPSKGLGTCRLLPGDTWGEERLAAPSPLDRPLVAAEDSVWLRWSREILLKLASSRASLRRTLAPVRSKDGDLLSGFAEALPSGTSSSGRGRPLRSSLRPVFPALLLTALGAGILALALTTNTSLPGMLPLAAPAVFFGWLLIFLLKRLFVEYRVEADAVTSHSVDWSRLAVESRHVPADRIQGVEVSRDGLVRRIMDFGTVIVKTSALEGVLEIRDVREPDNLARRIRSLGEAGSAREAGRELESLRRTLESSGIAEAVPHRVRGAGDGKGAGKEKPGDLRFRKSPVVLLGKLLLPLLVTAVPLLSAGIAAELLPVEPRVAALTAIIPLLWAWYRFEDWRNDRFTVSGGYVIDLYRKPLGLKESRRQVELASVQNIRTEQKGLISFLFRYGDVILVTAGGASDTVFSGVSRPWRVQQALFRSREEGLRLQDQRLRDQRKDDFVKFAEALDQIRN